MYHQVNIKIIPPSAHTAQLSWISKQVAIISPYSSNGLQIFTVHYQHN